jgi:hypothetical protein
MAVMVVIRCVASRVVLYIARWRACGLLAAIGVSMCWHQVVATAVCALVGCIAQWLHLYELQKTHLTDTMQQLLYSQLEWSPHHHG